MIPVSIIYSTARKAPKIEWFFEALSKQASPGELLDIQLIIVDFWAEEMKPEDNWTAVDAAARTANFRAISPIYDTIVTPVMPNVWQGRHRLTRENWFAASAVRNTGIALARHGSLVFVDDLSCPLPTWWPSVKRAVSDGGITCGAYRKVKNMFCTGGELVSFEDFPNGHDNRFGAGSDSAPVPCHGNWLYGCSLVAPVEAFLEINGFPMDANGMGFEDCLAGIMLEKHGWNFEYARAMMTYESEELHHVGLVMKRSDYGVSPNDKSHALLKRAQTGNGWEANYYGEEELRGLRQRVLAGEPFPICQIPQHEFFTGQPLSEL